MANRHPICLICYLWDSMCFPICFQYVMNMFKNEFLPQNDSNDKTFT